LHGQHRNQPQLLLGRPAGRLGNNLTDLIFPPKTNAANERLAHHLWAHRDDLFTFLRQRGWTPPTGGPNW
jgi:hypothetical protein